MKNHNRLILCIVAGTLFLTSLPLPYWTVIMKAPTYPERNLSMRVYAYKYEGDIEEWDVVGNLVGVKVPPPIPEIVFKVVPAGIVLLAVLSLVVAFRPGLLKIAIVAPWVLLGALTAWTQYALYLFGHTLAADRPLRYLEPFTPPVIGVKKIGSLMTYHLPYTGSFVFVTAALLLFWAYTIYRKERQYGETPEPA